MINEFKKINNTRQQRKFLDKKALSIKKMKEVDSKTMDDVLALYDYLVEIGFWKLYDGLFEDTVNMVQQMKEQEKIDQMAESLTPDQQSKIDSICEVVFNYEKPVAMTVYDQNKKEVQMVLVQCKQLPDEDLLQKSRVQARRAIVEMVIRGGTLDIRYMNARRVLKKFSA